MNLAASWHQLWTKHRNAVLAAGGAGVVGAAVIIRNHNASSSAGDVGYPAAMTGGAVPTLDTTATDTASEFADQIAASEDFQQKQFDALNDEIGGLQDTLGVLGRRLGNINKRLRGGGNKPHKPKPPKAPRPKKPHQTPKHHHKPPAHKPPHHDPKKRPNGGGHPNRNGGGIPNPRRLPDPRPRLPLPPAGRRLIGNPPRRKHG